jgi:hypothetical protein
MHRTHLPLRFWFWAAHLIANHHEDVSARLLSEALDVTYKTGWRVKETIRRRLHREPLQGLVEVGSTELPFRGADESLDRTRRGRIIVAAAMSCLEIRIKAIPDNRPAALEAFVRLYVKPGATLLTDAPVSLPGYHRATQRADEAPRLPITFEMLRTYRRRGHEPLDKYLNKFVAYHNDRYSEVSFDAVLRIASTHVPARTTTPENIPSGPTSGPALSVESSRT